LKDSAAATVAGLGGFAGAVTGDASSRADSPPNEVMLQRRVPVRHDVDVFVAGGGPAGVAAAAAAARQGARVFLAERNTCLGGMGTAGMLPLFMPFSDGIRNLAGAFGKEILRRLKDAGGTGPDSDVTIRAEVLKRVYDDILLEAKVQFLFHADLVAVECDNGKVSAVVLAGKSGLFAVKARVFLDCTHLDGEDLRQSFPNIFEKCMSLGIDIRSDHNALKWSPGLKHWPIVWRRPYSDTKIIYNIS